MEGLAKCLSTFGALMDLLGLGRSGLFPALRKNFQLLAAVSGACEMMEASPIGWLVFGTLSSPGVGTSLIEGEDTGCLKAFLTFTPTVSPGSHHSLFLSSFPRCSLTATIFQKLISQLGVEFQPVTGGSQ